MWAVIAVGESFPWDGNLTTVMLAESKVPSAGIWAVARGVGTVCSGHSEGEGVDIYVTGAGESQDFTSKSLMRRFSAELMLRTVKLLLQHRQAWMEEGSAVPTAPGRNSSAILGRAAVQCISPPLCLQMEALAALLPKPPEIH